MWRRIDILVFCREGEKKYIKNKTDISYFIKTTGQQANTINLFLFGTQQEIDERKITIN